MRPADLRIVHRTSGRADYTDRMIRILIIGMVSFTALAGPSMDAYISQVNDLVSAQRAAIARLAAPAQATASALLSGGRFYLNNSFNNYWFYEGIGRAGGLMQIEEYTASATPRAGDVVWISYT